MSNTVFIFPDSRILIRLHEQFILVWFVLYLFVNSNAEEEV